MHSDSLGPTLKPQHRIHADNKRNVTSECLIRQRPLNSNKINETRTRYHPQKFESVLQTLLLKLVAQHGCKTAAYSSRSFAGSKIEFTLELEEFRVAAIMVHLHHIARM
jgi:hypothetical protein